MAKESNVYGFGRTKAKALNQLASKQLSGVKPSSFVSPEEDSHTELFLGFITGGDIQAASSLEFEKGTVSLYSWNSKKQKLEDTGKTDEIYNMWMWCDVLDNAPIIGGWLGGLRVILGIRSCAYLDLPE